MRKLYPLFCALALAFAPATLISCEDGEGGGDDQDQDSANDDDVKGNDDDSDAAGDDDDVKGNDDDSDASDDDDDVKGNDDDSDASDDDDDVKGNDDDNDASDDDDDEEGLLIDASENQIFTISSDYVKGAFSWIRVSVVGGDIEIVGLVDTLETHPDSVIKLLSGRLFILERLGGDKIKRLSPSFEIVREHSFDANANPYDACESGDNLYIPLYGSSKLKVLDAKTLVSKADVDLSLYADSDGLPEMSGCANFDGSVLVSLEFLENWSPSKRGALVKIDANHNMAAGMIELLFSNPHAGMFVNEKGDKLFIGSVGEYGANDGGIEILEAGSEITSIAVTEEKLGGDLSSFVMVDDDLGFAVVMAPDWSNKVVKFRISTLEAEEIFSSEGVGGIALLPFYEGGKPEWLLIGDRNSGDAKIRAFEIETGKELEIDLLKSSLPPLDIVALPKKP